LGGVARVAQEAKRTGFDGWPRSQREKKAVNAGGFVAAQLSSYERLKRCAAN